MRTLICFISLILTYQLAGQSFTKITTGDLVNTPSASRSANFVDVNGDSWDDIFISNGPSAGQNNMLYLSNQDGTFITLSGGPIVQDGSKSDGASFGDVDNDGDLDACVVTWYGQVNYFYRNQGNGEFNHEADNVIGTGGTFSETASWGDYDADGWLDLIVTNSSGNKKNQLFHNLGNGEFEAVNSGPLVDDADASRSADWIDYDLDGDLDLFITNEGNLKNSLYQNNGSGVFTKITGISIVETMNNSAGSSWADIDNDGDFDLFVANWENQNNQLFLNEGDGTFTEVSQGAIVNDGGCSFGSSFADADNDGDLDLYVCNAFCTGQNNFFYINEGNGTFIRDTASPLATDEGWTFGCAWGDLNNDGFVDLVLANCKDENQTNALYQNDGNSNHWFKLQCTGIQSNRSAIGAIIKIKATINGQVTWQMRRIEGQSGYCSQNSLNVHFGLADATLIDSLIILWPSGTEQIFENIVVDQFCKLTEGADIECSLTAVNEFKKNKISKLTIFPNPVSGESITIENPFFNTNKKANLKMYAENGQLSKSLLLEETQTSIILNVSGLPSGSYQITIETKEKIYQNTLIIQ